MLDFLHFCCQCGEMVVRLRRLVVRFRLKFIVLRRLRGAFRAFPILISRISQSIPPFSPPFYSKSTPYINISHLSKPPYRHSNRRKKKKKSPYPTFKNDENNTQNSKIHTQNSGYEVHCGENSVLWRRFHD